MATIKQNKTKQNKITSVHEDVEKLEPLYTAGGSIKWYSHHGKSMVVPPNVKNRVITI